MHVNLVLTDDLQRVPIDMQPVLKIEIDLGDGRILSLSQHNDDLFVNADAGRLLIQPVAGNAIRVRSE
jgi:hypothetical protein